MNELRDLLKGILNNGIGRLGFSFEKKKLISGLAMANFGPLLQITVAADDGIITSQTRAAI